VLLWWRVVFGEKVIPSFWLCFVFCFCSFALQLGEKVLRSLSHVVVVVVASHCFWFCVLFNSISHSNLFLASFRAWVYVCVHWTWHKAQLIVATVAFIIYILIAWNLRRANCGLLCVRDLWWNDMLWCEVCGEDMICLRLRLHVNELVGDEF